MVPRPYFPYSHPKAIFYLFSIFSVLKRFDHPRRRLQLALLCFFSHTEREPLHMSTARFVPVPTSGHNNPLFLYLIANEKNTLRLKWHVRIFVSVKLHSKFLFLYQMDLKNCSLTGVAE